MRQTRPRAPPRPRRTSLASFSHGLRIRIGLGPGLGIRDSSSSPLAHFPPSFRLRILVPCAASFTSDMDAFYASVEQRDRPELRGEPVAVGGRRRGAECGRLELRGAAFGVRSAMSMARAVRSVPGWPSSRPTSLSTGRLARCSACSAPSAACGAALARRGVSRCHRKRLGEPLAVNVARRLKDRYARRRADGVAGVAQQVPRQDRLGMEEADDSR